jgi:hypothetical protein
MAQNQYRTEDSMKFTKTITITKIERKIVRAAVVSHPATAPRDGTTEETLTNQADLLPAEKPKEKHEHE